VHNTRPRQRQVQKVMASDSGSSVTLIFYKIGADWWREPALNLIAAAAQMSSYCHVEIGIGE